MSGQYNPLYRVRHRNTAPRRPPSDPIPRRICQPHELLRAQRTHPQPPDFGGGGPSCPAGAAAQPPLPPGQPGPLRERPCCFNPPLACGAVQPGVFRGSELRFRLTIIPVIVSPTRTNRVILTLPAGKMGGWSTPRHRWFLGRDFWLGANWARSTATAPRCAAAGSAVTVAPESSHSRANPRCARHFSRPPALQRFPPLQMTGIGPLQKTLDTASTHYLVHPHARGEHC